MKELEFMKAVNREIGPVLELRWNQDRSIPIFELILAPTDYVMRDQVVLNMDDKFAELVTQIGLKFFGIEPRFNNTGLCFWFIESF